MRRTRSKQQQQQHGTIKIQTKYKQQRPPEIIRREIPRLEPATLRNQIIKLSFQKRERRAIKQHRGKKKYLLFSLSSRHDQWFFAGWPNLARAYGETAEAAESPPLGLGSENESERIASSATGPLPFLKAAPVHRQRAGAQCKNAGAPPLPAYRFLQ